MKVAGIITEYNPFHNGHQYQIDQVRSTTGADHIVVIMSGNFLERGVPAIIDKYTRTKMALTCGADLVLELPSLWSTASAERFADAGVTLLASTGVIDTICYGTEQPNASLMKQIVRILTDDNFCSGKNSDLSLGRNNAHRADSVSYTQELLSLQKQGLSYPAARAQALSKLLSDYDAETILAFLNAPNNILAIEYEKSIAQWNASHPNPIHGYGIRRIGGGYHDATIHNTYSSATAIRNLLLASPHEDTRAPLRAQVPSYVYNQLTQAAAQGELIDTDDFSAALYARLWSYRETGYTQFADCSTELSNKIVHKLDQFISFTDFASLLKTREVTYTRVCRVLMHILLGIRQEDYLTYAPDSAYLRVLGFRREAAPLLTAVKKEASLPLVTKMADASHILSDKANDLLASDTAAADLYRSIRSIRLGQTMPNEFTQKIVIV